MKEIVLEPRNILNTNKINRNDLFDRSDSVGDKISPRLRQIFVALGPTIITISFGMAEGFSAILLPQLEEDPKFEMDKEMSSWIASLTAFPMAIGCILGGILMEKIGRKMVHMVCCFPTLIGWLVIYFANDFLLILIGRFITGFCVGVLGPPTGVYMSETSDPQFRGFLLGLISFAIAFGIFLSHVLGTFLTWQNTALISCSFPIFAFVIMIFAPESPTYLAKKGKFEEAKKAFYWCRGKSESSQSECNVLLERQSKLTDEPKKSLKEYLISLKLPEFRKPLFILSVFFVTMQWSGSNAIVFYAVDILKLTIAGSLDEYLSMAILDIIRLIMSILGCVTLKVIKRRPLAIISGFGTCLSLFALSIFTYLSKSNPDIRSYSGIPMTAFVVFICFMTVGFVPLPWTMMGEVFPLAHRGLGTGFVAMLNYIMIFSVVKSVPGCLLNLGMDGTYLLYAVLSLLGTIYLTIYLPETKDKPLYVIEDSFKRRNK